MKYTIVHIADIHIGAVPAEKEAVQLKEQFIDKLKPLSRIDYIFIAGDLFHTKILVNSKHFKVFVYFFDELATIAKEKGAKIRIIKGTESHDYRQLKYIQPFVDRLDIDCKIFNTVGAELTENLSILYIPEEYMENKEEFYKDYIGDKIYDLIVFHGVVTETCFQAAHQESAITISKAPVLDTKKLMYHCRGPILGGHIHTRTEIKSAIFYTGSFFRWCFGEEEPKGWYIHEYDTEDGSYTNQFMENELADNYKTIAMSLREKAIVEDIPKYVDDIAKMFDNLSQDDMYRLVYSIPEDFPKPDLLIRTVNEFFVKRKNVKVLIKNNAKIKEKAKTDEKLKLINERYKAVLDRNASLEEKIQAFIKIKFGKDISLKKIRDYIYKPIELVERTE